MTIPAFTPLGLLPPGIHDCALAEFEQVFAFNARRQQLFQSLLQCLALMHNQTLEGIVLLNGSYATDKDEPGDMEFTLDVRQQPRPAQDKALLFHAYQHANLYQTGIDWYPTLADNQDGNFIKFFQYIGEKTAATKQCKAKDLKGILRLTQW